MIKVIHTNYRKLGNRRQRIKNKNKLWLNVLIILWCTFLWRRQWHPTPVLLPGKSHGWRAWWAAVHGVAKSRTRLSDFTFTFLFPELEKEMATHSSALAWRIPGTGEPGGLPSNGVAQSWTWLKWLSSRVEMWVFAHSQTEIPDQKFALDKVIDSVNPGYLISVRQFSENG